MPLLVYKCEECEQETEHLLQRTPESSDMFEYCAKCDKVTRQGRQATRASFRGNFR